MSEGPTRARSFRSNCDSAQQPEVAAIELKELSQTGCFTLLRGLDQVLGIHARTVFNQAS